MLLSIAKTLAKSALDVGQAGYGRLGRALGLVDFPVPPNSNMRRTSSTSLRHYRASGIKTGLPVATAAALAGRDLRHGGDVLDFGAGVGRQLAYFVQRYPDARFHACDAERSAIDWLSRAYPTVTCYANDYTPPLRYPDASFDLIYSISIFSHLTERDCRAWLAEFARVTKPGGVLCVTTMGHVALAAETTELTLRDAARLRAEGSLHYDYDVRAMRAAGGGIVASKEKMDFLGDDYGVTFFDPAAIRDGWTSAEWDVVGVAEGVIDDLQDLVTLRRR